MDNILSYKARNELAECIPLVISKKVVMATDLLKEVAASGPCPSLGLGLQGLPLHLRLRARTILILLSQVLS